MAVVVDYGSLDPELGIYGIYNNFKVRVTTSETAKFKTSYRFKLTIYDGNAYQSDSIVYDVEVNNQTNKIGIVNPVKMLQERWFKGDFITDDIIRVDNKAYTKVKIEVGESYADTADIPATFRGYDTLEEFYFYNGYETINQNYRELNYRDPNWYDTIPIKVPLVQKIHTVFEGDRFMFAAPIYINGFFDSLDYNFEIKKLILKSYTVDGIPVDTTTLDLLTLPGFIYSVGYFKYEIIQEMYKPAIFFNNPVVDRVDVYFEYLDDSEGGIFNSEIIKFYRDECLPKYDRFRLRWTNRYGADEYMNFVGNHSKTLTISGGKNIISDNTDYNAVSFSDISKTTNPDLISFGKTNKIAWELNSDYLTQEQINALADLYKSPKVLMYDNNDEAIPVIVQDRNYKIDRIENNLVKVTINLLEANTEPNQIQ